MVIAPAKMVKNNIKTTDAHIHFQIKYMARTEDLGEFNELKPLYTNCAGDSSAEIIREMQAMASLRPELKKATYQVVFSPEAGDRILTGEELRKAIDIYRKKRGLADAPFAAYLHTDGHKDRHEQHVHLMFVRVKSDGSLVKDSWDSSVQREASRQIERELGLKVNAGAGEEHKYNGRDKDVQRQRAAERRGDTVSPQVDPDVVARAIDQSRNPYELKRKLADAGIECRFRYRNDQIYAWSLRNAGGKEWTSGSKLTASNTLGWHKVRTQLDTNFADRKPTKTGRKHPTRMRGLNATKRPLQTNRIDQLADAGVAEGLEILQQIMSAGSRKRPITQVAAPTKPTKPSAPRRRATTPKPRAKDQQRARQRQGA